VTLLETFEANQTTTARPEYRMRPSQRPQPRHAAPVGVASPGRQRLRYGREYPGESSR